MLNRRLLLQAGLGASLLPAHQAIAQPIDQVKILYGFPAGSAGDVACRRVADKLGNSAFTKNAAVVENKPGAGGRLALDALKSAPADGTVLAMGPYSTMAIYPHIFKKLGYDPLVDFQPVSMCSVMHHGFAVGSMVPASVKNLKDFVAWAQANPDKANFGSPGAGSTPHFLGSLMGMQAGVDLKHVPYRGSVPGVTDVVGGQIAAMCTPSGDFIQNHRAGKLRMLATSGPQRAPWSPDVATFAEQGFGELTTEEWFGFVAPAKVPASLVNAASSAIQAALKEPAMIDALAQIGLIARGSSPAEMGNSLKTEFNRWGPLVKRVGFTADS